MKRLSPEEKEIAARDKRRAAAAMRRNIKRRKPKPARDRQAIQALNFPNHFRQRKHKRAPNKKVQHLPVGAYYDVIDK